MHGTCLRTFRRGKWRETRDKALQPQSSQSSLPPPGTYRATTRRARAHTHTRTHARTRQGVHASGQNARKRKRDESPLAAPWSLICGVWVLFFLAQLACPLSCPPFRITKEERAAHERAGKGARGERERKKKKKDKPVACILSRCSTTQGYFLPLSFQAQQNLPNNSRPNRPGGARINSSRVNPPAHSPGKQMEESKPKRQGLEWEIRDKKKQGDGSNTQRLSTVYNKHASIHIPYICTHRCSRNPPTRSVARDRDNQYPPPNVAHHAHLDQGRARATLGGQGPPVAIPDY